MSRKLIVVGAGYTGARLALLARERGWDVAATTSDPRRTEQLRAAGVEVRNWRHADGVAALAELFDPGCAVVYSIPPSDEHQEDVGLEPHVAAVDAVMRAARATGAERFVYLSSTSSYGDHGEEWIDEDSDRNPTSQVGLQRKEVEDHVLSFDPWNVNVVRIVGIYGPGRTLDRYLTGGRYKLVDGGYKKTNRIHVDDLATTILAVLDRAPPGARAYIASDGHPSQVRELVQWLVDHRGIDWPEEVTLEDYRRSRGPDAAARWENTYLASNRRIVEELGVELIYPNVFVGYEAILDAESG